MQETRSATTWIAFCFFADEAAGSSNDWGYTSNGGLGAKYSYVMELRDTGDYGFVIPDSFINVSGRETYEAVKHFGSVIMSEYAS